MKTTQPQTNMKANQEIIDRILYQIENGKSIEEIAKAEYKTNTVRNNPRDVFFAFKAIENNEIDNLIKNQLK